MMFALLNKIPHDKALHALTGVVLFMLLNLVLSPLTALLLVVLAGIAKEVVHDRWMKRGTPDVWDAVATGIGGAIGFICTLRFDVCTVSPLLCTIAPIMVVLWLICLFTLGILGLVVYTVIRDCKKRAERRLRQLELYNGRVSGNTTSR